MEKFVWLYAMIGAGEVIVAIGSYSLLQSAEVVIVTSGFMQLSCGRVSKVMVRGSLCM